MSDTDWLGCLILPKTQEEARAFMIRETARMVIYFAAKVVVGSPTPEDIEVLREALDRYDQLPKRDKTDEQ